MFPLPCGESMVTVEVLIRESSLGTCCAQVKLGRMLSKMAAAVRVPVAKRCAPSRKLRRSISPCTYLSKRFSSSCGYSAAVLRSRSMEYPSDEGGYHTRSVSRLRSVCVEQFPPPHPPPERNCGNGADQDNFS